MSGTVSLRLERAVPQELVRRTVESQLRFYYPGITDVRFGDSFVEVHAGERVPVDRLTETVERIVERFATLPARIPRRVVRDSARPAAAPAGSPEARSAFRAAVERLAQRLRSYEGVAAPAEIPAGARPVRAGLNIYGDQHTFLLGAFDAFLRDFLTGAYAAVDVTVPSMISSGTVDRAGYFESGCQHLSFVAPIHNDPDVFDGFLPYWRDGHGDSPAELHRYLKAPRDVLNPALCLHVFPMFEGAHLGADRVVAVTEQGSCFRDESGNLNNAERLNEFRMREAVFLGTPDALKRIHADLVAMLAWLGDVLGVSYRIEAAADMFFNENADRQLLSQMLSDNKLEFLVDVAGVGKEVACASINRHHSHFAAPFDIREDADRYANTMCVGFGLDRLILATESAAASGLASFGDAMLDRIS